LKLTDEARGTPARQVRRDSGLDGLQPLCLQPSDGGTGEALVLEIGQRRPRPERESGPKRLGRLLLAARVEQAATRLSQLLEAMEVERGLAELDRVAGRPRDQNVVRLELLPEPGDVLLQRRLCVLGAIFAPELFDQAIGRDDRAGVEQEHREHAALFRPAEMYDPLTLAGFDWAENTEVEAARQSATVTRGSAG
jgi:hypothetical protein